MENFTASEATFTSWDGTELFYRSWQPPAAGNKALIIIHRGHEHSGRIAQQVKDLDLSDFWPSPGIIADTATRPASAAMPKATTIWLKILMLSYASCLPSMIFPSVISPSLPTVLGAVTASTWVHDFAPRIRAMVPCRAGLLHQTLCAIGDPLLRLLLKIKGKAFVSSYVKSKMLTHDATEARRFDADPLITRKIGVNILLEMHDTATRILKDAAAITTPTLILSAGSDWVVKKRPQQLFYQRLSSTKKQMENYPGFFHALLYEKDRHRPMADIREFIQHAFTKKIGCTALLEADRGGPTRTEYDLLRQPAAKTIAIGFAIQKFMMRTIAGSVKGFASVGKEGLIPASPGLRL